MHKVLWEKEPSEVDRNELMAYTLAKISPFEWVRVSMFDKYDIDVDPLVFCWRFKNADDNLYKMLKENIESYQGNIQWVMYKGEELTSYESSRNYTIEPALFHQLRKLVGNDRLADIIKQKYQEKYRESVDDIENLCRYIEGKFNLSNIRPTSPVPK